MDSSKRTDNIRLLAIIVTIVIAAASNYLSVLRLAERLEAEQQHLKEELISLKESWKASHTTFASRNEITLLVDAINRRVDQNERRIDRLESSRLAPTPQ